MVIKIDTGAPVITLAIIANIQAETLNMIEAITTTGAGISKEYMLDRVAHYLQDAQERIAAATEEDM